MAVKIRLSRGGSKKRPFYRIVAADARAPRDGKFIEKLGSYNPLLPHGHDQKLIVNAERVKYWVGCGALPTERVAKLLASLDLVKAPAMRAQPVKAAPKAKALERIKEKEAAAQAAIEAAEAAKIAAKEAAAAAKAAAEAPKVEEVSEAAAPVAEETVE